MYKEIITISRSDEDLFTKDVNDLLVLGWEILSANCGFVNSDQYDFCGSYQAILAIKK